jgi:Bacterial DNA-binding protein
MNNTTKSNKPKYQSVIDSFKETGRRTKGLPHEKLALLIAEEIDYTKYEVEDVLNGLRVISEKLLKDGVEVKLEHFITLVPKFNAPREFSINGHTGLSDSSMSVKLKTSLHLDAILNPDKPRSTKKLAKGKLSKSEVAKTIQ